MLTATILYSCLEKMTDLSTFSFLLVKGKSFNVRGVGNFFVTCSNLGHSFQHNFKTRYSYFPRKFNQKLRTFFILYGTFFDYFYNQREIYDIVGLLERENNEF